jgi:chemotaxis protein methyltransferase CheR
MTRQATRQDLECFRATIVRQVGLQFEDSRLSFLAEVLQRRLDKLGCSAEAYLWDLQRKGVNGEMTALARELTVGETYFFRNNEQFRALAEIAIPDLLTADRPDRVLRFLSAGCASGEEAYSLAILARETVLDPSWGVSIHAVDLNPAALERARKACYSTWALRETPIEVQRRWFRAEGRELALEASVREAVRFEAGNLAGEDPALWQPELYDVVFCRNVLMYFSPEQMRAVIARIARSLRPGGYLFLGHAETLRNVSDEFHLRHTHNTFYYQRKDRIGRTAPRASTVAGALTGVTPAPIPFSGLDDSWVRAIGKATERIAALVPARAEEGKPDPASRPSWDSAPAFELLRQERFGKALEHLREGPAERDPDLLLLEATLRVHSGEIAAAEEVCRRLLLLDELNAGAHYVQGLCCEHRADRDGAGEHYQIATYLDPEFAMPRLHLGLLARRAGDRDAARRELAQAVVLLEREDPSRLLLFGGGFSREALIALCGASSRDNGWEA